MEMPDGKQRQPDADLSEATLWYLRSKAKHLPIEEMHEFANWLRRSPENASTLLSIANMDRRVISRWRETGRVKQALRRVLRRDRAQSQELTKHCSISQSYFKHLKQKHFWPKIGLLAATLCGVAVWMFVQDVRLLKMAAVAFGCLVLLWIREVVVGIRVANGYFGTTESEVRDFVKFISAHSDNIDFTDQGGKRRPALVPERSQRDSVTSTAPGRAGALPE